MHTNDPHVIEFLALLRQWHDYKTSQLRQIVEHRDADLVFNEMTIAADSEAAKGVRLGVDLSLHLLGTLPFSVSRDECEECEEQP